MKNLENHDEEAAQNSPSLTSSRHTPGPWTNKEHSTFVWSVHGNVCACGDPHASGYVGYTECHAGSQWLGEAVANARLIAAAPDMLEALKAVTPLMIPGMNWTDETGLLLKRMVLDAIAKAEGRS